MIGIKIQNLLWQETLLDLFSNEAQIYQENQSYRILLTDTNTKMAFPTHTPIIQLGKDISLPCQLSELKQKISQLSQPVFENKTFKWLPNTRQLIHKATQEKILLTEKEAQIISFLANKQNRTASREELLQNVWQYQNDVHTHTLESHIYTLKQKLTPNQDELIVGKDGLYYLI